MGTSGAAAIGASRRLSRGARETFSPRPRLSEFRDPRRDCKTGGAARGERPLAARSRRRAALSRHGKIAFVRGACAIARIGCALRAAARHGGSLRARRRSRLDRARRRSRWRGRRGGRPAGSVGRRHPRAQGNADQLSPLGGGRRRLARGDRGGAGSGPVLVDQRPPAVAAAARPAASRPTATTASSSMLRDGNSRSRPRPPACANSAPEVRRRPTSAAWSACLDCHRFAVGTPQTETPSA